MCDAVKIVVFVVLLDPIIEIIKRIKRRLNFVSTRITNLVELKAVHGQVQNYLKMKLI